MTKPLRIVGMAGSLRNDSYCKIVLNSLAEMLPPGSEFANLDIGLLPYYNQDFDTPNGPVDVLQARDLVASADAVLMVVPEFNHGIPGVLKNTLDWLSRPAFTSCMVGKPVMFVTLSPGALGGVRAQYQLRETLAAMLCKLDPLPEVAITFVGQKISEGQLTDETTRAYANKILTQFLQRI
ncbi:NADPH-dependent FMN reductase [Serratia sp. M24T3]|uniref:NADPH-dependent FMN reductase n=1 Tax=Rouxiella sp. WC2420 TaxID=3234145 RepID=A0AB39VU53_9GAMM|nr:NADPH-dependent FMN reductase [Serratia sp. M24T3]EIC82273.1 NADPH-dependent FMN reductase [Serratia sp. M24T3]